jgi:hypothetical protein
MFRRACLLAALALARASAADVAASAPTGYTRVEVAPTRTSIYIGTVAMTMPTFVRHGGAFESTYVASVFPYFFYNESGTLRIDFPDAALARLARGEPVDFTGRAVRTDGAERRIEGRATPADARSGKLKVRVFYSRRIELIFNTTYRFPVP